jgi:hypothetical protein
MTTHELIEQGLRLTKERQRIDAELSRVRRQIEPLFPAVKTQEDIQSTNGMAVRTVRREWWIKPRRLAAVRNILGKGYAHLIDEEMPLTVTPGLRALINNPNSAIGLSLRPYIIVNRATHIAFRDPVSDITVGDDDGSVVMELVDLIEGGDDDA